MRAIDRCRPTADNCNFYGGERLFHERPLKQVMKREHLNRAVHLWWDHL